MRNADNVQKKVDVFVCFFFLLHELLLSHFVCILPFLSPLNISFNFHVFFFALDSFSISFPLIATLFRILSVHPIFLRRHCDVCSFAMSYKCYELVHVSVIARFRLLHQRPSLLHKQNSFRRSSASLWCLSAFVFSDSLFAARFSTVHIFVYVSALPSASFQFSHNEQIFLNCVKRKKVLLIKLSVAKRHFQCTYILSN